jgi:proline iminopeptidase
MYYETMGSGPAFIAVHGGPGLGDNRQYVRWLEPLADSFTIVTYDLRGCGQSGDAPDGSYSHADFVADLEALREHLDIERFALLGTSYGGFLSLEYALRQPERLTHLVLQDTAPSNEHDTAARQNAMHSGLPGIEPDMLEALFSGHVRDDDEFRRSFAAILPLYRTTEDPDRDAERLEDIVFRYQTHNFAFSQNMPRYDLRARLGEIRTPTVVLCGRHDWITPVDQSEYMAAYIPGAELTIFEHSGHGPMSEENEAFVARVRQFLQEA